MHEAGDRFGAPLLALQTCRPADLQRGETVVHIELPTPAAVAERLAAWRRGTRGPVSPSEAAQLLWTSPVAAFLDGRPAAWQEIPGVDLLVRGLASLRAAPTDTWPDNQAGLRLRVAQAAGLPASTDLAARLAPSRLLPLLGDLVLLFKFAATGTRRPLGHTADVFRLATALFGDAASISNRLQLITHMNAPLQVPLPFAAPDVAEGPVARPAPGAVLPTTPAAPRFDLTSPAARAALQSLERDLDRIESFTATHPNIGIALAAGPMAVASLNAAPSATVAHGQGRTPARFATLFVGGMPVVLDTTEAVARQASARRALAAEIRSALPAGLRDRLDEHQIAVEDLSIWPVISTTHPPSLRRVPSYLQPAGRIDLLLVRQATTGYRRAEIAHVENIMIGETRDREHLSRVLSSEQTFASATSETEETDDLQTAHRAEIQREVSKVVSEDLQAEGSVQITSRGPTKVVASAGAAYARSTQDAAKTAANYARETVERAVKRTLERHVTERRSTLERETSESNRHGFTRPGDADDHTSGIYQTLERVSRARLFWYGEREMYDLLVPEPASLLWHIATQQPAPRLSALAPDAQLFESLTLANIEQNLEAVMRAFHVVDIPELPVPKRIAPWGTQARGTGGGAKHAADGEIRIPEGYEVVSADFSVIADVESDIDPNGFVTVGGKAAFWLMTPGVNNNLSFTDSIDLVAPGGEHPLVGTSIAVGFTADNFHAIVLSLTLHLELTEAGRRRWQRDAYARVAARYEQLRLEYEQALSQSELQQAPVETALPEGSRARLATVVRHELQRAVVSLMRNSPVEFDLMGEHPFFANGLQAGSHPTPDVAALTAAQAEVRFLQQAFEWEHLAWILYPYFWSRRSRWEQTAVIHHPDPEFGAFLSAGAARVQVPVRPGFETLVKHFMETGEVYAANDLPRMGDADYLPFVDEQLSQLGAAMGEIPWPIEEPIAWDIISPTSLVLLRGAAEGLPTWDPETGAEIHALLPL